MAHIKPRWVGILLGAQIGVIALKNVTGWDGDLTAVIALLSLALGAGLRDIFAEPKT
jgi:hypothetical protein